MRHLFGVALAAILAMRPEVLVLDEPTSELDPCGKAEVLAVLDELKRQARMTMVFVEQDAEALFQLADRVAVLDEGRVILQGGPREVFAPPGRLGALGLDVPQLSVAAEIFRAHTGRPYDFLTVEEAQAALKG